MQYDEGDLYDHFRRFYDDVLPEFMKAGKVVQFKVMWSCNNSLSLSLLFSFFLSFYMYLTLSSLSLATNAVLYNRYLATMNLT